MTWALLAAYGVGAAFGAGLAWVSGQQVIRVLREQLREARIAEALATDRLVHAWKDGAQIPPRPLPPTPPLELLPVELTEHLAQWEDAEHRAILESEIRAMRHRGMGTTAILMALDNQHP